MEKTSDYLIVIPAYNEEKSIEEVVLKAKVYADICVIDDCSADRTPEILTKFEDVHVISHEKNTHIAGALLDGMRYAVEKGYDYVIAMDAGMSHNPDEIPLFMDHPYCDLIIGTRISKTNTPFYRKFLSATGNLAFNSCLDFPKSLFRRKQYKDITSGYRRYSKKAIRLVLSSKPESKSADILFETTMIIYRHGLTISEVPITYNFSNSYCDSHVIIDCISMCLKSIIRQQTGPEIR